MLWSVEKPDAGGRMGRLIITTHITVDSVVEAPSPETWLIMEGNHAQAGLEQVLSAEALLLGRKSCEGFAAVWPGMTDDTGYAEKMNGLPKYVASTTLEGPLEWNATLITGDLADLFSLMVHLRPAPVVARVATCMPRLQTPIADWLEREIAVTEYLSGRGRWSSRRAGSCRPARMSARGCGSASGPTSVPIPSGPRPPTTVRPCWATCTPSCGHIRASYRCSAPTTPRAGWSCSTKPVMS
jgi:hypothetical protein